MHHIDKAPAQVGGVHIIMTLDCLIRFVYEYLQKR